MLVKTWMCFVSLAFIALPVSAENYTIDPGHTYPSLEFPHMGLSIWRGKFNSTTGHIKLNQKKKTGQVEVAVDVNSIDFGHDEMNVHALTEEWLDAEKYPVMVYKGDLKFEGKDPVAVVGELTLRGVTRPLELKVNSFNCIEKHPFYKKKVCGADAEGELNRADYGMDQYTENGMGILKLRIQVEAIKD